MERKKNIEAIRRLLEKRREKGNEADHSTLTHFLVSKGIAYSIAKEITLEFTEKGYELNLLQGIVAKRVHTLGDLPFDHPKKIALVGPTGVGKTTTLIKLALYYTQHMKKNVAIVTLDPNKQAHVSLEANLLPWKIPLFLEIESVDSYDLVLIDTEGCNFYQPNRVDAIGEKLAVSSGIEVVLTLSASTKDVDLYGAIHQFSPLQPSSLAFTKLDETLTMGALINVSMKTDLPIRYISFGYPLPGEVQIADPEEITHKILTELNDEEFQFLRELTMDTK